MAFPYVSLHTSHKKICFVLNLGEGLCISTFFLFPDSRLNLLNGFDFFLVYFKWYDTENHQYDAADDVSCRKKFLLLYSKVDNFSLAYHS